MFRRGYRRFVVTLAWVTLTACHNPDQYTPMGPDNADGLVPDSVLAVTATATSIRADGGSRTRVEAHIDPSSTVRTVSFTTSAGILFANGGSVSAPSAPNVTAQALQVVADSDGVAAVELQATTLPATARVTASVTVPAVTTGSQTSPARTFTRSIDISFVAVPSADVINVTATPTTAAADGASRVHLVATVTPTAAAVNQQVEFLASNGEFATGTQGGATRRALITLRGTTAEVDLIAPTEVGTVSITANVGGSSAPAQITFTRALPDTVFVEVAATSVSRTTGSLNVTALLFRDIGSVANNTVVTYTARDADGDSIGAFSQVKLATPDSEDQQTHKRLKSTAVFNPDDTAALGTATITATAGGQSGSVTVQITN